jgi:hypothetical protein
MHEATQPAPERQPAPPFLPVARWNEYYPWPPQGGLRHLIFHAESNGFAPAIRRVGGRVLINTARFWQIVDEQGAK